MNRDEKYLMNALNSMDSVEYAGGVVTSGGVNASLQGVKDNPQFVSQIDLKIDVKIVKGTLMDEAAPDFEVITPDQLPDNLKTDLPFYMFGRSDSSGGYANNRSRLPVNPVWTKFDMGIYKAIGGAASPDKESALYPETFAAVESSYKAGDMIHGFSHFVDQANAYFVYVSVSCKQIAYSSLLESTQSDRFVLNMIRYAVNDVAEIGQFEQQLQIINLTMFGKQSNDFISPSSYRAPSNFQDVVIDIPLTLGIDKQTSLSSYVNYDTSGLLLSIFIVSQKKLVA